MSADTGLNVDAKELIENIEEGVKGYIKMAKDK